MGRPREFDVEQALDAALRVFWRKGYEGASYADRTEATGVERPALYSAFGNKEALFRRASSRYYERYLAYVPEALARPTSRHNSEVHMLVSVDRDFDAVPESKRLEPAQALTLARDGASPANEM